MRPRDRTHGTAMPGTVGADPEHVFRPHARSVGGIMRRHRPPKLVAPYLRGFAVAASARSVRLHRWNHPCCEVRVREDGWQTNLATPDLGRSLRNAGSDDVLRNAV